MASCRRRNHRWIRSESTMSLRHSAPVHTCSAVRPSCGKCHCATTGAAFKERATRGRRTTPRREAEPPARRRQPVLSVAGCHSAKAHRQSRHWICALHEQHPDGVQVTLAAREVKRGPTMLRPRRHVTFGCVPAKFALPIAASTLVGHLERPIHHNTHKASGVDVCSAFKHLPGNSCVTVLSTQSERCPAVLR